MKTWQSWNNVIDYIMLYLGSSMNKVEFNQVELMKHLKEHVMPKFSIFDGVLKIVVLGPADQIGDYADYAINLVNDKIVEVRNIYLDEAGLIEDKLPLYHTNIPEMLMNNTFNDMVEDLNTVTSYKFMPPNIIRFNEFLTSRVIIVFSCVHETPQTIPADIYMWFQKYCLGHALVWIANIRLKFESLNTPHGVIQLNARELKQEGMQYIIECEQAFQNDLPPDKLVYWASNY